MRPLILAVLTALIAGFNLVPQAFAQPAVEAASPAPQIVWEVKNRFRLFRNEADFQKQVAAYRAGSILAAVLVHHHVALHVVAAVIAVGSSVSVTVGHRLLRSIPSTLDA